MTENKFSTPFTDPLRRSLPQRPILLTSNSCSKVDLSESMRAPNTLRSPELSRNRSITSPSPKHYADNLYNLLEGGINPRKRLSRNTMGLFNPLLESLAGMQKMLITKQVLLGCQNRSMMRDVKISLQNADENLDGDDPFQCEGFSLNTLNPKVMEFKFEDIEELKLEEGQQHFCGKLTDAVEEDFNDREFAITLTEKNRTKSIGSVRKINGEYHVFDQHDMEVFQVQRIGDAKRSRIAIVKRKDDGEVEKEMGSIDLGNWNTMTLEAEISYAGVCTAKEKLLILGMLLAMMMKIQPGRRLPRREPEGACSVGGLWKEVLDKMRALF